MKYDEKRNHGKPRGRGKGERAVADYYRKKEQERKRREHEESKKKGSQS
jgi:hypothetical protein